MALRDIEKADRFLKDCSQRACPPSDVGAWIVERVDPFLIGWPIAQPRADLAALVLVQVANVIGLEPIPVLIAGPLDRDGVFVAADPDPRRLEILLDRDAGAYIAARVAVARDRPLFWGRPG